MMPPASITLRTVLRQLYYSITAWLRGFRRFFIPLGFFLISEGLVVGEAGSGRQKLTQK